jgi:hypothetical protein
MAKLKGPLISLDATGPLGKELTYQSRKGQPLAIATPTHPDARTLPQIYQRARYYDATQAWLTLTTAQKLVYTKAARPLHMTGMALYIRTYLAAPPDLAGWWHLDEPTGATLVDISPNHNNGTPHTTLSVPGKLGQAQQFNGTSSYISIPKTKDANPLTTLTLMAWVYPTAAPPHLQMILYDPSKCYLTLHTAAGLLYLRMDISNLLPQSFAFSTGTFPLNAWTHLAASYSNHHMRLYIAGELDSDTDLSGPIPPSPTDPIYLGRAFPSSAYTLQGNIDDTRYYTRELTDEHIKNIAQAQVP